MLIFTYMKKRLEITIPGTCTEDWNSMSQQTNGKFCSSCQKEVIDFTGFSDGALQLWFMDRQEEKVCGRFLADQLHGASSKKQPTFALPRPFIRILAALALVSPFAVRSASGQTPKSMPIELKESGSNSSERKPLVLQHSINSDQNLKKLRGKVIDSATKETLLGAVITVKGTFLKVESDLDGNFEIPYDYSSRPDLIVSSIGYISYEHPVGTKEGITISVALSEMVVGGVCIVRRPTLFQRLFKKTTRGLKH